MTIKQTVKKIIPAGVWNSASQTYWYWRNRGRHVFAQKTDPRFAKSQHDLMAYKDSHKGERCFILGNGPSLNNTDLELVRNEVTFGLNRIYLLFPKVGFQTNFLVSVNDLVLQQTAKEMAALNIPKFVTWRARKWLRKDPNTIFINSDFTGPENFTRDATGRIFEGFTVTFVALQLAFYMGFEQVVLIGVDHNFTTKGKANEAVISQGDDPNHFAANYFGKGFKWQLPDLEGSERAYTLAREAYQADGRQVLDATVGGKLTIFPKVDYNSLF
jgi:hypothetical protein